MEECVLVAGCAFNQKGKISALDDFVLCKTRRLKRKSSTLYLTMFAKIGDVRKTEQKSACCRRVCQ